MARVAQSEHDLLLVARALVGQVPFETVEPLLRHARKLPPRIGPTAARLLRETLARGCVHQLMRRGGWRRDGELRGERVLRGRAWERQAAPALQFSPLSMHVCRWLVTTKLAGDNVPELPSLAPTIADELVLYLAAELLAPSLIAPFAAQEPVRRSPLCRLAFAEHIGASPRLQFARWIDEGGGQLVAALAPDLARHWLATARRWRQETDTARVIAVGAALDAVATDFLDAADALDRRDLGSFVLDVGAGLLRSGEARATAAQLCGHVDPRAPLSQRAAARLAAGAPLRALARVARWNDEHKLVRHFDDEYPVAQFLLQRCEPYAPLFPVAEGVLRELASLDALGSPTS